MNESGWMNKIANSLAFVKFFVCVWRGGGQGGRGAGREGRGEEGVLFHFRTSEYFIIY